jgi:hypothetical protein
VPPNRLILNNKATHLVTFSNLLGGCCHTAKEWGTSRCNSTLVNWRGTGRAEPWSVARQQKARFLLAAPMQGAYGAASAARSPTPSPAGKKRGIRQDRLGGCGGA